MNSEPRDKFDGLTISEWIKGDVGELKGDAVGLFGIIDTGRRGFGLHAADLALFTRLYLLGLMRAGARPVIGGGGKGLFPWIVQPQYGSTPEEIVDAVVQEWLASGEDPDAGGLWFATPSVYNLTRS